MPHTPGSSLLLEAGNMILKDSLFHFITHIHRIITANPNYEWLSPVPSLNRSNWAFKRGLTLAQKPEIPFLAFILILSDGVVRSHGGESVVARSMMLSELTVHRAVAREGRAGARCGQDPPGWLPGSRAVARCPASLLFGFPLVNPCFPCSS
ncbi:hypothetical protein PIB30_049903 [Stylosanthes scabra]|uniref:Uncharacterized protein n=1 Tax=Stylosanthes scabra TaxID=79078 RepID=A0ABU6YGA6_9FABA|nr:hypothetical protein [Stylosanthes scabra]